MNTARVHARWRQRSRASPSLAAHNNRQGASTADEPVHRRDPAGTPSRLQRAVEGLGNGLGRDSEPLTDQDPLSLATRPGSSRLPHGRPAASLTTVAGKPGVGKSARLSHFGQWWRQLPLGQLLLDAIEQGCGALH